MSHVVYFEHALCPHNREVKPFACQSLAELDPKWQRPYIALVDGKPVLRKDWGMPIIGEDRVVVFVDVEAIPQGGGGGSNPLRIVAMIAVMVVAFVTGQWWASAYGASMLAAGTSAAVVGGIQAGIVAGVTMVGTALVNAVIPAQSVSMQSSGGNSQAASPTYNLQAQGNQARLDGAIPEHFGRHKAFPDFAAQPYQEFAGNEQYLYQLFCIGRGYYDIEAINIDDTPVSNFEEITYEIVNPHEALDLFPGNVVTATEVSGQVMAYNTYIGPFTASAPQTQAYYLGIDYIFPRGLYRVNDKGNLLNITVSATAEARLIDDSGAALGSWFTLGNVSYSAASAPPLRYSARYPVAAGRYEVRVKRTSTEYNDATRYGEELVWGSLRAYFQDTRDYGDCTLLAMRMRASNQLTNLSARKVNVIATRKLPVWNGSSWSAPTQTRSIAWAACYCAKEMGLADSQIDLATAMALDTVWANRADFFDARFDTFVSFWEALTKILAAGRAKPYLQGGVLRFFRDQAATMPVALFNKRNIIKNSLTVQYLMPTEDTADCVEATYFDSVVWAQRRVTGKVLYSTSEKPAKIELFGVTNRPQAFREATYQAASNRYRRKLVKFSTEMDGFIPSFGDLVAIQHDVPAWGQGGELVDWDPDNLIATTSEQLTWEDGESHYIGLRAQNGRMYGPYACLPGATEYQVQLTEAPDIEPYVGSDAERTYYTFGWAETVYQRARVLSVRPKSTVEVELECVNEDDNVHTAETGQVAPPTPVSQLPNQTAAPVLKGLIARSKPGDPSVMLLSWEPTPWAEKYYVEASGDGTNWIRLGDTGVSNFAATALYGNATVVRVAAVGTVKGPWVQIFYGDSADYMWNALDTTLMWNVDDTTLMWRY